MSEECCIGDYKDRRSRISTAESFRHKQKPLLRQMIVTARPRWRTILSEFHEFQKDEWITKISVHTKSAHFVVAVY